MRITTQQIRQIISEELSKVLYEEDNSNALEGEIAKLVTDEYVEEYDEKITQQIFALINNKLPDIKEPKAITYLQSDIAKDDPKGALQMLRMVHYDFTPEEEDMVENIEIYPFDKDNNTKKEFLINKKAQEKDLSGLVLKNIDFGTMDLSNANMEGAILRRCNLSNTTGLDSANMTNSSCDPDTKWPEGFDPAKAGVGMLSLSLVKGFCKDITYSKDPKYKQISKNYQDSKAGARSFSEQDKLWAAYLKNVSTEELMILMCRTGRGAYYPVYVELLRRGYLEEEIDCARFDKC